MKISSNLAKVTRVILILGAVAAWSCAEAAGKTMRPSPHRLHHRLHDQLRNHHRPTIKVTGVQKIGNVTEISCEFSARAGFVDRIELRVGGKVISTKKFDGPATKGALKFKVDLSGAGAGKHKFQLRGYQGRRGYQTVHGDSRKRTITH